MKVTAWTVALYGLAWGHAGAADCVIRVAYPDRERPPYYFGRGAAVPEPAGAGVDLIRAAVRSVGCSAELVRLPTARIKYALSAGSIDFAPVDLRDGEAAYSALPLSAAASPDKRRGIIVAAFVYVRAADQLPAATDPRTYFRDHTVATMQGSPLGEQLRDEGFRIDDGAADQFSNLDKVLIRRADGFAVSLANADALDAVVAQRYAGQLVRLGTPLRASTVWLSASKSYYDSHGAQVEQLWNWWGDNAARKLGEFVKNHTQLK